MVFVCLQDHFYLRQARTISEESGRQTLLSH